MSNRQASANSCEELSYMKNVAPVNPENIVCEPALIQGIVL